MKLKTKKHKEVTVKSGLIECKAFMKAMVKVDTDLKNKFEVLYGTGEVTPHPHYIVGIDPYDEDSTGTSMGALK